MFLEPAEPRELLRHRPAPIPDHVPLSFYVNAAGDVVPLERVSQPATWSEHVRRQTLRGVPA